jgi:hypothetical protein
LLVLFGGVVVAATALGWTVTLLFFFVVVRK